MVLSHVFYIFKRSRLPWIFEKRKKSTRKIDKILIANRGEIACRVIRTASRMGIRCVAVYSDIDSNSMHVNMANEAYRIGPPPAQQSYLRGDVLIDIAKRSQCQAIHPGYGFLSENVEFAADCQEQGIIFIGPPPSAIRDMGIKSTSKYIMSKAGVPIIEGYHGGDQSNAKLKEEAARIGYPIMIKAVRGGGGKGMRVAHSESEFIQALNSARSESQKAFGDSDVLLERFVADPRHVEVQVFADIYGNAVHLFERDCSVQRRHQKIIEEAPAPGISAQLRSELGEAAVKAAKAVGYVGAGTVEFILDRFTHSFHFMEMNTRLQVEHPITEMITGVDLVEWQIKTASGEKLPLMQEDIALNGHAFEGRIYAEDVLNDFLPAAGPLLHVSTPLPSSDLRIETGVRQGDEVSVHYDPMIAKLAVWGKDRTEALKKLQFKLSEYNIAGLETNVNFLLDLAKNEEFISGNVHTNFIKHNQSSLFKDVKPSEEQLLQAALAVVLCETSEEIGDAMRNQDHFNPFIVESTFRVNYNHQRDIKLRLCGEDIIVKVKYYNSDEYHISIDGGKLWNVVNGEISKENARITLKCNINGRKSDVAIFKNNQVIAIFDENGKTQFALYQPNFLQEGEESVESQANRAVSPMPGIVDKILVNVGDTVKKGDPLFVIIAMKMEHIVQAVKDAKITDVQYKVGSSVPKGMSVVLFEDIVC